MNNRPILLSLLLTFVFTCYWWNWKTDSVPESVGAAMFVMADQQDDGYYYIFFRDKMVSATPELNYLDPKSLQRRERLGLPVWDEKDWPLNPGYVAQVRPLLDSIRYELRWLNALSVKASPAQLSTLAKLPFVKDIRSFRSQAVLCQSAISKAGVPNPRLDTLLSLTRNLTQLDELQLAGLSGKGVRIALLDAGFKGLRSHPAFENLMKQNGIIETYDFYKGKEDVFHSSTHGLEVLSCLAGHYQGRPLGAAWEAEFLLARVVKAFLAAHNEEDHWIAAAEWAERKGADIISTSITYVENYRTPGEMDGQSSPVTQAAQIATQKGVLVVSAMGNQGDKRWRIMGAPADAEEVLSVGGTYPMIPQRLPMASMGPNARRKLKPDVAAPAFVLSALKGKKFGENTGTSFSSPIVAGMAACLLEKEPGLSPGELLLRMQRAGHFYPYYDYDLGYGVPDMRLLLKDSIATAGDSLFQVRLSEDTVWIELDTVFMRTDTTRFPYGHMLYYHLERPEIYLSAYQTFRLPNLTQAHYFLRRRPTFGKMRIWMDGYLYERRFNGE